MSGRAEPPPQPDPVAFLHQVEAKMRVRDHRALLLCGSDGGLGAVSVRSCYSKSVLVEERGPSVTRRAVPASPERRGERGSLAETGARLARRPVGGDG